MPLSVETTMGKVREFSGWQDELNTLDNELVTVYADGSVNHTISGDLICEDGFGGGGGASAEEAMREWCEHWGLGPQRFPNVLTVDEYLAAWNNTPQTDNGPNYDDFHCSGFHYYIKGLDGYRRHPDNYFTGICPVVGCKHSLKKNKTAC